MIPSRQNFLWVVEEKLAAVSYGYVRRKLRGCNGLLKCLLRAGAIPHVVL